MKKIMIVDDEFIVRVGIKSILDWEEHGYSVVCEAENGADALEKMKLYHPDLVLTDLKMDPVDGFELITQCRTKYPQTRFIVLSSYNDFDNVRRAMKLGAADYIFKLTAKPEDILAVLDEVSKSMEESPAQNSDSILLKNISAIKSRLIKTAIQQSYLDPGEFLKEFGVLNLKTDFRLGCVSLYISIDDFYARQHSGTLPEIQLLKFSLENIVQEVVNKNRRAETYNYDRGDLIVLVNVGESESYCSLCGGLKNDVEAIVEYVRRYLSVEVTASLSKVFTGADRVHDAVGQNLKALSRRFLSGGGKLYVFSNEENSGEFRLPEELNLGHMEEFLWKDSFAQAQEYFEKFWRFCRTGSSANAEKIRIELLDLYHCFRKHAVRHQIDFDGLTDDNGLTLYEAIANYDMLSAIEKSFGSIVGQYRALLTAPGRTKGHAEIERVKLYVRQNLASGHSVQAAAKMVNMSESYFSHLFKSETGMSFINYVNKTRIEQAESLLRNTDERISEISLKVGIDNPNYFSILFKKITGKSPNAYRS